MRLAWRLAAISCGVLLDGAAAWAAEPVPGLEVAGYATLAAHRADDPVASYRPDSRNANASRDGKWRTDGDSTAALQLGWDAAPELRFVWQLLAKDDVVDRFKPRTEWLYADWRVRPDLRLRAGRMVLATFQRSQTRHVGYAQTNARTIDTVYQLNPATNLDGVGALWSRGEVELGLDAGRTRVDLPVGHYDFHRAWVATAAWRRGPWQLRFAHSGYRLTADLPQIRSIFALASSGATACTNCADALAARVPLERQRARIDALSLIHDDGGRFSWQAEFARRSASTSLIPTTLGAYGLVAWRAAPRWTPYAAVSRVRYREPPLGLQTASGAPASAHAFNAALDRFLQAPLDRNGWQLGVRLELAEGLALKAQLDGFRNTRDSTSGQLAGALLVPLPPALGGPAGPAYDGRMRIVSVNLDYVF